MLPSPPWRRSRPLKSIRCPVIDASMAMEAVFPIVVPERPDADRMTLDG
jgi:hypothetical protein